ncbi:MAG: alpha/beta fold hydrolase [Candidatus Hodarchaeales archaeon]|jgi:pimeloyl-ACP methyl ester carboxylesterase
MNWTLDDLIAFRAQHLPISTIIDNTEWTYYDIGNKNSNVTLVFIHGTTGSKEIYWLPMRALLKHYRIISFDLPAITGVDKLSEGIFQILSQNEVESIILIGTSFGGYLAQNFSFLHSDMVKKLVLSNTFITTHLYHQKFNKILKLEKLVPEFLLKKVMKRSLLKISHESTRNYLVTQLENNLDKNVLITRLKSFITTEGIKKAPIDKILIIETTNDPLVPIELQDDLKKAYTQANVITLKQEVDHFPYLTLPEQYHQILVEFINS